MRLTTPDPRRASLTTVELIAMVGGLMALNALSIDILLPALGEIGADLGAPGNNRQLVITAYVFGFGLAQLAFGPLSDALGRRRTLLFALVGFLAATALCIVARDMVWMIVARGLQGVTAAATRVVAVALVRDLVSGRRMAEIMSFAMTVFMVAPILAPSIGQGVLLFAGWQMIFGVLFILASVISVWMVVRMPETLRAEHRIPLSIPAAIENYRLVLAERVSFGYVVAAGLIFGALFAFIATSEQILAELYGLEEYFALAFGGVAIGLAAANIINARIVRRLGMRRISHSAVVAFLLINVVLLMIAVAGQPPFWLYFTLMTAGLLMFAWMGANFSALVMEPAGERAGTAAALYGGVTSMSGATLGSLIGQTYDHTVVPVISGFVLLGTLSLAVVLWTERGKLFAVGEIVSEGD